MVVLLSRLNCVCRVCQITELTPEIRNHTALEKLSVAGNKLTALPAEVGLLVSLREVYFGGNPVSALCCCADSPARGLLIRRWRVAVRAADHGAADGDRRLDEHRRGVLPRLQAQGAAVVRAAAAPRAAPRSRRRVA
jgi:hypothetical protein